MLRPQLLALLLAAALVACRGPSLSQVNPSLGVDTPALDFGAVKPGRTRALTVVLEARTNSPVALAQVSVAGEAFALTSTPPERLAPFERFELRVAFSPAAAGAFDGVLTVGSDDVDAPQRSVPLRGLGVPPVGVLSLGCDADAGCAATVTGVPLRVDFGEEPLVRRLPLPFAALPFVTLQNVGVVPLSVGALAPRDAGAFAVEGPPLPLELSPDAGATWRLRFTPTLATQQRYADVLELETDEGVSPRRAVALAGTLRPNLPPAVCLNLTQAGRPGAPRTWTAEADWAPLRAGPPDGGYDFRAARAVRPADVVTFSATSGPDERACTSDPEDGRLQLTYAWTLVRWPTGSNPPPLVSAASPAVQLVPLATGEYELELRVEDAQRNAAAARAVFRVANDAELAVQLAWAKSDAGADVDLDLHLVRPLARPFGVLGVDGGVLALDSSAFSVAATLADAGVRLDWGLPGAAWDDPTLTLDDTGAGARLEAITLDGPANDSACAAADCVYEVWVHQFRDARARGGAACVVSGCLDGERCGCGAGLVCVADVAPRDAGASGAGRCRAPVPVDVRVFAFAREVAAIPLPTLTPPDELGVGAPCHALHVADVVWPRRGADAGVTVRVVGADGGARVTAAEVRRFGLRPAGPVPSQDCAPNARAASGALPWYAEEPR